MPQAALLCPEVCCLGVQLHTIRPEAQVSQLLLLVTCVMFSAPLRWALQTTHFGSGSLFMGTTNPFKTLLHDALFVLRLSCSLLGSPLHTPKRLANSCKDALAKFLYEIPVCSLCSDTHCWHWCCGSSISPSCGSLSQNLWHDEGEAQVILLWTCQGLLSRR